jgi:hypothetical protein
MSAMIPSASWGIVHGMNNINCIGYVKYSVRRDVMYLVVQSYSENVCQQVKGTKVWDRCG